MSLLQCFLMIGLPGSGKSTVVSGLIKDMPFLPVISTDNYIDAIAKEQGSTYDKVFQGAYDLANKKMQESLTQCILEKKSFIWDQTNLNAKSRKSKIELLRKKGYEIIAISMNLSDEEYNKRLSGRNAIGDKIIRPKLLQSMKDSYEPVTYAEGVKEIYLINDKGEYFLQPFEPILKI